MNTYKIKNLVNPDLFFGSIVVPSGTTYTFAVGDLINTTALISGFAQYSDIYFKIVSSGALIVVDDVDQSFVDSANLLAEYYNEPYTFLQLEQVTLVKPVYDVENSGVVDNSQKLDGQPANYYATNTVVSGHINNTSNPHNTNKSQVGLGNVDNTSDLNKPLSNASINALANKADNVLVSGHINNTSNPHNTTASQVGNNIAQWNANALRGINLSASTPTSGQVLTYNSTSLQWEPNTDDDSMYATVISFSGHVNNTSNPHNVTASQVGRSTAQWNADRLQGTLISTDTPSSGQFLTFLPTTGWTPVSDIDKRQNTYQPRGQGGTTSWSKSVTYEYTVTVAGAQVGDAVVVNPEASLQVLIKASISNVMMMGYVSAINTVKVLCKVEVGGTNINLTNTDAFRVTCI